MDSDGHFNRLRPVVVALARHGARVHVFTHARFRSRVANDGGHFVDLFAGFPPKLEDRESLPRPCRAVSFAGFHYAAICPRVSELGISLIVYDTYAVIGRAVALSLGLPFVNVCAGHNLSPRNFHEVVQSMPGGTISKRLGEAVGRLRDLGMADAGPYAFATGVSPYLNLYCEPPQFLVPEERDAFEPIAFFGSIQPECERTPGTKPSIGFEDAARARLRVYVSFGTVVWKMFRDEALKAIRRLVAALAQRDDVVALISLGGRLSQAEADALSCKRARVRGLVDQWQILRQADVFVTHQGLNSTHESIYLGVPMVSYPWFSDQIGLARRCRELGLAIPLVGAVRAEIRAADLYLALERISGDAAAFEERLTVARRWERETIAGRGDVVERLLGIVA